MGKSRKTMKYGMDGAHRFGFQAQSDDQAQGNPTYGRPGGRVSGSGIYGKRKAGITVGPI
jgi:hypothetical protein